LAAAEQCRPFIAIIIIIIIAAAVVVVVVVAWQAEHSSRPTITVAAIGCY
jgi:hypothetical protein